MKYILGISAFYHDSAAALICDGEIIAAVQEERFSRIKHDNSFPINSIHFLLKSKDIDLQKIDAVVFYEKPFLHFERLLETYVANAPKGFKSFSKSMPLWLKDKLFQKNKILKNLYSISKKFSSDKLFFCEHHLSHAASAFFPSPFKKALILTVDGVGEWSTTTVSIGDNHSIKMIKEIKYPHSLGLLYSAFTYYLGFKVNSGEYKVMGLAPYGQPTFKDLIYQNLIDVKDDGTFRLNQKYFSYSTSLKMTNDKFNKLFGKKNRNSKEKLEQFHMDIASSIQKVIEETLIKIISSLSSEFSINNLCLAGGVALNCVANGKILETKKFKNIWIQPASGDAGGSLGAALYYWYNKSKNNKPEIDSMKGSYLGPDFSNSEIEKILIKEGAVYKYYNDSELLKETAILLSQSNSIGWFQGRMEFGPRALGSRSILADPRSDKMQKNLNLKIKFRESFRPFAPSILEDYVSDWFDLNVKSPYMLLVANVKKEIREKLTDKENRLFGIDLLNVKRSTIPAVTHVDYSARVQTVHFQTNSKYYNLINEFFKLTGCPIVINTSFNVRGEPIVNTPLDAYNCFMGTNLDVLVLENYILIKNKQNKKQNLKYIENFELD